MSAREIVVHEKRPRWRPELERQFAGEPVRVRTCRGPGDIALPGPGEAPPVVVLDFDAAPAETLQWLGRWTGRSRRVPVIVIGSDRTAELEWPVRELGAVAFLTEDATGEGVAALCRRQWTS